MAWALVVGGVYAIDSGEVVSGGGVAGIGLGLALHMVLQARGAGANEAAARRAVSWLFWVGVGLLITAIVRGMQTGLEAIGVLLILPLGVWNALELLQGRGRS